MGARKADTALNWTDDPAAAELLVRDPMALMVGFLLDQQVAMEVAFGAPEKLRQRLGSTTHARHNSAIDAAPAGWCLLCPPTAPIWRTAADAAEVSKRIARLPGFSANKARVIIGTLAKRLAVPVPGWEEYAPDWFSLADVDSKTALLQYRG